MVACRTYEPSTSWFLNNWFNIDAFNMSFIPLNGTCTLIDTFASQFTGLAIYNATELDATRWMAVTTAGSRSYLPVSAELLTDPDFACLKNYPVKLDFRSHFATNLDAYQWALDILMEGCNHSLVYSAGYSYTDSTESVFIGGDPAIDIGIGKLSTPFTTLFTVIARILLCLTYIATLPVLADFAVANRAFVFNLSPANSSFIMGNITYPGWPAQAAMFSRVLLYAQNMTWVYGWAEPETAFATVVTAGGCIIVCDGAPNLSWWSRVPVIRLPWPQPTSGQPLEDKFYMSFQTNEADTPKILTALMQGEWLSPNRGAIPMSWGVPTWLSYDFPALQRFYFQTARPNDTFFAGVSGNGYSYAFDMPNFEAYATRAGEVLADIGPNVVDVWDWNLPLDTLASHFQAYNTFAGGQVNLFTYLPKNDTAYNVWTEDGTPVIMTTQSLFYPSPYASPDPIADMVDRVVTALQGKTPPFFLTCYGTLQDPAGPNVDMFTIALGIQAALGQPNDLLPAPLEIVGITDLARLAKLAGQQKREHATNNA
jgi:hypothetical protein